MARKKQDALAELDAAILEMANDAYAAGAMDEAMHRQITMRQLGTEAAAAARPLTGEDIRALREEANMSQAVFARYLNMTPHYLSRLERGAQQPTGTTLALLNVIRRHGMEMVLG
jgi:putative transcriptional regulator